MTMKPKTTIFDRAAQLVSKREALEKTANNLQTLLAEKEAGVAAAKKKFGRASAEHTNGHLPKGLPEEDALQKAEAELKQVEMSIVGCREATSDLENEAMELADKVRPEFEAHRERVLRNFLDANADLRTEFANFLTQGKALAQALGLKLNLEPTAAGFPHPFAHAMLELPPHVSWQQDDAASTLYHQHCDAHRILTVLQRQAAQSAYRKTRPDLFPPDRPMPRTRYRTREVLKFPDERNQLKAMPVGTILSAFNVPTGCWGVLAKLEFTRKIVPIPE